MTGRSAVFYIRNTLIMKQLLVAFDFSKNALNTLEYALMMANRSGANLSLVWVDDSSTPDNVVNINKALRIETRQLLNDLIPQFEARYNKGKIDVILRKGKVYTEIANVARKIGADVVLSGTHGVSGFEQFWIGSNAYRIVTHSPCPVITIRSDYQASTVQAKKIVLPIDSNPETKQKIPFATKIAAICGAKIHVVSLYNSPISLIRNRVKTYTDDAAKYLQTNDISYVVKELEAENLVSSLLNYTYETKADLICIMTEQGGTSGGMFLGPYAQQLINNSLIPVLSQRSGQFEP